MIAHLSFDRGDGLGNMTSIHKYWGLFSQNSISCAKTEYFWGVSCHQLTLKWNFCIVGEWTAYYRICSVVNDWKDTRAKNRPPQTLPHIFLHYRVLKPLKMKRRLTICANKCAMGGLAHNEACGQKERYTLDRCSIGQVQVLYNAPIWMRTFSCVLNCGLESSCIVMQLGPYPVIDIVTTFDSTATGKHSAWHLHFCAMFQLEMLM